MIYTSIVDIRIWQHTKMSQFSQGIYLSAQLHLFASKEMGGSTQQSKGIRGKKYLIRKCGIPFRVKASILAKCQSKYYVYSRKWLD